MRRSQTAFARSVIAIIFASALAACGGGGSSGGSGLTGIDVSPVSQTIEAGGTVQYKATGHYSNGPDQDLTVNSTWSSSATNIATINNLGLQVGLATGVAPGQTTITASFAQGSSSVTGSTDLTVTAASPGVREAGMAAVLFRALPEVARGEVRVDGRALAVSGEAVAQELPSGLHRFGSADGRHVFTMQLQAGRTYNFEIGAEGRLALDPAGAAHD